ncbi:hypothetical protein CLV58_1263 [Spirosoma oryzae]|uniref:Uncharacterized protein n=1 Tax=Spirosoma oryzae TaxID=1469603 RepID=A0A2T0S716_9BACT|nr:hypothetical protein [Spirosoma oryzae]PRY29221.1 hypothetical protein CLV58_1263 [Spirosoma oryzae]
MFPPPFFPADTVSATSQQHSPKRRDDQPPRRPDWLVIFMGVLFLLSLLLLWLVDIPQTIQ